MIDTHLSHTYSKGWAIVWITNQKFTKIFLLFSDTLRKLFIETKTFFSILNVLLIFFSKKTIVLQTSLWKSDSDSMDSTGIPRNRNGIGIEIQKYSGSGMESELRLVEVESK